MTPDKLFLEYIKNKTYSAEFHLNRRYATSYECGIYKHLEKVIFSEDVLDKIAEKETEDTKLYWFGYQPNIIDMIFCYQPISEEFFEKYADKEDGELYQYSLERLVQNKHLDNNSWISKFDITEIQIRYFNHYAHQPNYNKLPTIPYPTKEFLDYIKIATL